MGLAFSIDAVSFLFSLASLTLVRVHSDYHPAKKEGGVLGDVAKGVSFVRSDPQLRAFILYMGAVSVFVAGPLLVGLPVLANTRMDLGAKSLGLLRTANGAGIMAGSALSGFALRRIGGRGGIRGAFRANVPAPRRPPPAPVLSPPVGVALLGPTGMLAGPVQMSPPSWVVRR